jgi:hypothetical protein
VKGSVFAKAAFVAALTGALLAAFAPTYTSCSTDAGGTSCGSATGLSVNGSWILFVVSVPVVLALIPILVPRRGARIIAAVLLWACCRGRSGLDRPVLRPGRDPDDGRRDPA